MVFAQAFQGETVVNIKQRENNYLLDIFHPDSFHQVSGDWQEPDSARLRISYPGLDFASRRMLRFKRLFETCVSIACHNGCAN